MPREINFAPSNSILASTVLHFVSARKNLIEGAKGLYEIEQQKLWEGHSSSFSEFVEAECQISKSFAAKLIAIWGHYIEENKIPQDRLEGIDAEKLYLAIKLGGTAQEQAMRAETLTRQELRQELNEEKNGECTEHIPVTFCSSCRIRL